MTTPDKANGREALELPIHPDPHAWTWTEAEKRVILAWGESILAASQAQRTETAEPVAYVTNDEIAEHRRAVLYPGAVVDTGAQLYAHPPASTTPDISPEDSASILDTYRKLHEGKIGAHWLWCVIEQIAAGVSEEEALKGYGYYSTAPAVYRNAVLEESAQAAEQATFRRRQARSWANAEPVQPCEVAAAIREIKSSKEEDHAE